MNQHGIFKKWLWAGVMGILTILLCLIVSDDLLGLNSPPARSQMGHYVFWVSLIGLPLLFYRFVSWRYTLLNIPLYFLLYFPVYELCGLKHTHLFLQTSGFISFPVWFGAILVAACFWGDTKPCISDLPYRSSFIEKAAIAFHSPQLRRAVRGKFPRAAGAKGGPLCPLPSTTSTA